MVFLTLAFISEQLLEMECKSQEPMLQGLQQEFKELISMCNDDEAAVLTEQFDKMMQDYTQMEDCLGGRKELCDKWSSYADAQRDIQGKIKVSQVAQCDVFCFFSTSSSSPSLCAMLVDVNNHASPFCVALANE